MKETIGTINFGLFAIKGVSMEAINEIVREREMGGNFKSLNDFIDRVSLNIISKSCIEALIYSGAFDQFGGRNQHMSVLSSKLKLSKSIKKDKESGQGSIFDLIEEKKEVPAENEDREFSSVSEFVSYIDSKKDPAFSSPWAWLFGDPINPLFFGQPAPGGATKEGGEWSHEKCPVEVVWRSVLPSWSIKWREEWGKQTADFEVQGMAWWRAEVKAFLKIVSERTKAEESIEQKTMDVVAKIKGMFPRKDAKVEPA